MEITLEKVDKVRERTGEAYAEAKECIRNILMVDVLDAIIYIRIKRKNENSY